MRRRRAAGWVSLGAGAAAVLVAMGPACEAWATEAAGQVVLRLKDGAFEFTGRLRSFDGRSYLIDAGTFGIVSLDASRYECSGAACAAKNPPATATAASTLIADAPGKGGAESFAMAGSATVGLDLMPALIRDFAASLGGSARQHLGADPRTTRFEILDKGGAGLATIGLERIGDGAGLQALSAGEARFAMTGRAATPAEIAALTPLDAARQGASNENVLALDGLAVIVAPDNPLTSITREKIAGIFSGSITSWAELGQPAAPIRVYASADGGAASDSFAEQVLRPRGLTLNGAAILVPGEAAVADRVARDPLGIGITSLSLVRNARGVDIAGSCGLKSKARTFTVKAEEYPLSRRIYLYTGSGELPATARALTDYFATARAQDVIRETQFVDQAIERSSFKDESRRLMRMLEEPNVSATDKARLRNLVAALLGGERLSLTFRFAPGSAKLDAKAREDVLRLRDLLRSGALKGKSLHLIGFADATGTPRYNLALSVRRAALIREDVLADDTSLLTDTAILSSGYGHLAPVVCNEGVEGLMLNRRVEVWVTDGITPMTSPATTEKTTRKRGFLRRHR